VFLRVNHQRKKRRCYRNSPSWQSWLLSHSTKRVSRTRPNRKLVWPTKYNDNLSVELTGQFKTLAHFNLPTLAPSQLWSRSKSLTGVDTSSPITRQEPPLAVSSTWVHALRPMWKDQRMGLVILYLYPVFSLWLLGPHGDMLGGHSGRCEGGGAQLGHQPPYQSLLDSRDHQTSRLVPWL